jgi:hypothetical protein
MMKVDQDGFKYFEKLPDSFREASIDDFHIYGKLKIGMEFFILGYHWQVYQCYQVTPSLTSRFLKPFIDDRRVFIFNSKQ